MLSETIAGLERVVGFYAAAGMSPVLSLEDCRALLAAAKLSEARARACELAKALIANTQGMSEGECGFWEHIEPLKTALAAAEKGSA